MQLKLFLETRIKSLIVPQCGTIQGCGTNQVNTVAFILIDLNAAKLSTECLECP